MKRSIIWVILAGLLLITACAKKQENELQSGLVERNVRAVRAERRDFYAGITATGRIEADVYLAIAPAIPGRIDKINVSEGDRVVKDQILAVMDMSNLRQAELNIKNLEKNLNRAAELLKSDAIEKKSYEEIETAYKIAKTTYDNLAENTYIKAPVAGMISAIAFKEGELFNQMMSPFLMRLLSFEQMKAVVYLSDREFNLTKPKMRAEVAVNSYPDKSFVGMVDFISPEAERMSGLFRCEVLITDKEQLLRHNQFARVFITTNESKNALVIPHSAIVENRFVFVVEEGKSMRKEISIGLRGADEIAVTDGISEGDLVITVGNIGLTDNYPVNIIE